MIDGKISIIKNYNGETAFPVTSVEAVLDGDVTVKEQLQNINNSLDDITTSLENKASKNDVAKISSGTPLFADSESGMTNTSKNYVNTTDGYLYIYSNSKWTKTDVKYQSTGIESGYITTNMLSDSLRSFFTVSPFSESLFQIGNVNDEGEIITSVVYNNIVTTEIVKMDNVMVVVKDSSVARIKISYYDNEGNFIKHSNWTTEPVNITTDSNVRIGICLFEQLGNNIHKYTVAEMLELVETTFIGSITDKVNNLSVKLDSVFTNESNVDLGLFELGAIGGTGENVDTLNTRIRTKYPVELPKKWKAYFNISGKYELTVTTYNLSTGKFMSQTEWVSEYTFENTLQNVGYRFALRKVDQSNLTNCINEVANDFKVVSYNVTQTLNIANGSIGEKALSQEVRDKLNNVTTSAIKSDKLNNFIHISFDDVELCFKNLATKGNTYNSLFDEPFFAKLKEFNDNYGAVFSLYIYNTCLSNVPTKFKQDFVNNSRWLKIGFHTENASKSYANATRTTAQTDYNNFINNIYPVVGGHNSIDRIPRLNFFAGSQEAILGMRDCNCGILGLLSTDDSRNAYYFNSEQLAYLRTNDKLDYLPHGLIFFSTDFRLDWFNPTFTSTYEYNKPIKSTVYEELKYRYTQPNMANLYKSLIVFTHEWQVYNGNSLTSYVSWIEDVCKFANEYNFDFDFPQNRINEISSYRLFFA